MRTREPDAEGYVDRDGVKLHYEVFGDGGTTLLLLPAWTVVHWRFWKAQVPYLARHFRVVTYDGPGNGRSDRPLDPAPYGYEAEGRAAVAVLDATGAERAVLVSLSMGAEWALWVTAHHPERVLGAAYVCPSLSLAPGEEEAAAPFDEPYASTKGWAKYNRHYWLEHWGDFEDEISPLRAGEALAEATGGSLAVVEGAGHIPLARDPVTVNLLLREFVESLGGTG
jgi:pimeloyl-ACP methyl ester carboxylesterase